MENPRPEVPRGPAPIWRALQVAAAVLVIGLAVRALVQNWETFRAQEVPWTLSPLWLGASFAAVLAAYAVLIEAWRRAVLVSGESLRFLAAARIWLVASLGKYLPGKVWAVAGAAVLAKQEGVDPMRAVSAALLLQAMAVASGFAVAAVTIPTMLGDLTGTARVVTAVGATAALLVTAALAWPRAVSLLQRFRPAALGRVRPVAPAAMVIGLVANVTAWLAYGVAFYCLGRGLIGPDVSTVRHSTGVFAGAYVIGLVTVFAPGGIGPRESVLVLLLLDSVGPRVAVALAVASRLQLTLTELACAVPFLRGRR